jgi:glucose/arabinose dehydrogenase
VLPVAATGEAGLLGLALDPGYQDNHYLYLYFTYRQGRALQNRVVRLAEMGGSTEDQVVLLDGISGATIHNGGRIKFGPDGKLYISTGDAAQPSLSQDLTSLVGKVLRLNPDGSIPADNPFSGSPVFSYGHRNPQGLAWQPGTDKLYATEHGPRGHDEVNLLQAGGNYGWPEVRGQEGEGTAFSAPVLESGGSTWAPSGAAFCDGPCHPGLSGRFLFAGLRSTALWWVDLDSQQPVQARPLLEGRYGRIRDVVQGPDGSLYLLTSNRDGRGSPSPEDDRLLRVVPGRR